MKIKRFLIAISLLSLLFCSAVFTACKGKFDDVHFSVTAIKEIAGSDFACEFKDWQEDAEFNTDGYLKLYMAAGEDGNLKHVSHEELSQNGALPGASDAYLKITISNVPAEFSKGFSFTNTNTKVVSVITGKENDNNLSSNGGTHIIKLSATGGGRAIISFYPNAGGIKKEYTLTVDVVCPLNEDGMKPNTSYNPYVVAGERQEDGTMFGGQSLSFSENLAFVFTPSISTEKEVEYSFEDGEKVLKNDDIILAEIKGKELFVYNTFENNEISVFAENTKAENLVEKEFKIKVKVIHKTQEADLVLTVNGEKLDEILLSNNILDEMQKQVAVTFNYLDPNAEITFKSSNENIFLVEKTTIRQLGNTFNFEISSNNVGEAELIVYINYPSLNYSYSLSRKVNVKNFVQNISVYGDYTDELYLYDSYDGDKEKGEKIEIITTPKNSIDNRFVVYINQNDKNNISLTVGNKPLNVITNLNDLNYGSLNDYLYSTGTIINMLSRATVNKRVELYFISYHSLTYSEYVAGDISTTINTCLNIELKKGVEPNDISFQGIDITQDDKQIYLVEKDNYKTLAFNFSADTFSEYIDVSFDDLSIAKVDEARIYLSNLNSSGGRYYVQFDVMGLTQGQTNITLTFANGVKKQVTIRCFILLSGFNLQTNKNANNSNVVGRLVYDANDKNMLTDIYMANTGEKLTVSPKTYHINIQNKAEYLNIDFIDITYASNNIDVITVDASGTISTKGIGSAKVVATITYYTEYGTSTMQTLVNVHVYTPISSIQVIDTSQNKAVNKIDIYNAQDYYFYKNEAKKIVKINLEPQNLDYSNITVNYAANGISGLFTVEAREDNKFEISSTTATSKGTQSVVFTVTQLDKVYTISLSVERKEVTKISILSTSVEAIYVTHNEASKIKDFAVNNINFTSNATFKDLLYVFIPEVAEDKNTVVFSKDENGNHTGEFTCTKAVNGTIYAIAKDLFKYNGKELKKEDFGITQSNLTITLKKPEGGETDYLEELIKRLEAAVDSKIFEKYYSYLLDGRETFKDNRNYVTATLEVADGSEEHPFLIRNYNELKNMDLTKHYLLRNDIDLFNYIWEPLGVNKETGAVQEFSGSINGEYSRFGILHSYSIIGLNLQQNINTDEQNKNYYQGLFAKINRSAKLENLTIEVNSININVQYSESSTGNKIYIGALAGVNAGTLNNINVKIKSSNINIAKATIYLGGVCGVNNSGEIKNIYTSGKLDINNLFNNTDGTKALIGGLFGENNTEIDLEFKLFGGSKLQIFEDNYNSSITINVVGDKNNTQPIYIGGAIGYTNNRAAGILTNNKINVTELNTSKRIIVGGVIGYALSAIDYCFFSGSLLCKNSNIVGGIVGQTNSDVTNSVMFIFDKTGDEDELTPNIIANESVGAIIGYLNHSSNINFTANYVRSYYSRDLIKTPETDEEIKNNELHNSYYDIVSYGNNVGGLIGSIEKINEEDTGVVTIERSYAYVNKILLDKYNENSYVGEIIGFNDDANNKIEHSFFKGEVHHYNVIKEPLDFDTYKTNNNLFIIDNSRYKQLSGEELAESTYVENKYYYKGKVENSHAVGSIGIISGDTIYYSNKDDNITPKYDKWVIKEGYNGGDYITLYDGTNGDSIMSIEPPTQITATAKGEDEKRQKADEKVFYKLSNDTVLLFYYKNNVRQNTIALNKIFSIATLPATSEDVQFLEYISKDTTVAKVNGSNIILNKEGKVSIVITSKLNKSIQAVVNLVVINALTEFEVYTSQNFDSASKLVAGDTENFVLGTKQQLFVKCDSSNVLFKVVVGNIDLIETLNGLAQDGFYQYTQLDKILLNLKGAGTTNINVIPIYYYTETEYIELLNEYDDAGEKYNDYTYGINIFEAIKDVCLDINVSDIYLDEYTEITLTTVSDNSIELQGAITAENFEIIDCEILETKEDTLNLVELNNPSKNFLIIENIGFNNLSATNLRKQEHLFSITIDYDKYMDFNIAKDIKLTIRISVTTGKKDEGTETIKTVDFEYIIRCQKLYNISSKYYGYNQLVKDLYGNTTININENETDKIVSGEWGLLDVELFPKTANIEKIEFYYTSNVSELLSVRQVLKHETTNRYYNYGSTGIYDNNSYTTLLPNESLHITKASTITDIKNGIYDWDGHLYLSLLVRSNISTTAAFTLNLKVYSDSTTYKLYTRTLGTTVSTNLSISFAGSGEFGVLVHQNNLNDKIIDRNGKEAPQVMLVSVQDIVIANSLSNLYLVIDGQVVSASNSGGKYVYNFKGVSDNKNNYAISILVNSIIRPSSASAQLTLHINSTIALGDKITIAFRAKTTINQKEVYVNSNEMTFVTSLYFVTGYQVSGVENGVYSKPLHSSYYLETKLFTRFSTINGILAIRAIQNAEIEISKIESYTNNYFYGVSNSALQPTNLNTQETYNNYTISANEIVFDSKFIYKTVITPKKVYTGDRIIFAVQFNYGEEVVLSKYGYNRNSTIGQEADKTIYQGLRQAFSLEFYFNATEEDHAQPIFDVNGLKNMRKDGYYRLTNDIVITEKWDPLNIDFKYFDGNGYTIILANGFNIVSSKGEDGEEAQKESTGNYGLFGVINKQSVVLNLTVSLTSNDKFELVNGEYKKSDSIEAKEYLNPNSLDYLGRTETNVFGEDMITYNFSSSQASSLNIGLIAGVNEGTIYNSFATQGTATVLKLNLNNNTELNNIQIGGLVAENKGFISYSKSSTSIYVEQAACTVGGLVAVNSGKISSSSFESFDSVNTSIYYTTAVADEEGLSVAGLVAINERDGEIFGSIAHGNGVIYSSLKAASFACVNYGTITNSYADIKTDSNHMVSGFTCINSGTINHSFSLSELEGYSERVYPFIGTNSGTVHDVYFIKTPDNSGVNTDEYAKMLVMSDIRSQEEFTEYLFAKDSNANDDYTDERNGIWLFNENLNPTLVEENYIANLTTNGKEKSEAFASWNLVDAEINEGIEEYNWSKPVGSINGDVYNPKTLYSEKSFNLEFSNPSAESNYVVLCDIEFTGSDITSTTKKLKGTLLGNNMLLSDIGLNGAAKVQDYFGLFSTIEGKLDNTGNVSEKAIVKNLKLNFLEVYANNSKVVGGLAGKIQNAYVQDVAIVDSSSVAIQGINLVGGLAGLVANSTLKNINVSISVNSSYHGGESFMHSLNLDLSDGEKESLKNLKTSYAGAIAGAVIGNSEAKNVSVTGNSRVIAYTGAAGFGYIGQGTTVNQAKVLIEPSQYVYTSFVGGGLIGENHGKIINSCIEYRDPTIMNKVDTNLTDSELAEQDVNFFKNKPLVIGGLVGINFSTSNDENTDGSISNCYSKIDVRNEKSVVAGGLVGVTIQGAITKCYATGSVLSKDVVGGLVGSVTTLKVVVASLANGYEQTGSGIFAASDLFALNADGKTFIPNELATGSALKSYNVAEDGFTNGTNSPYSIRIQNCMALNNFIKNREGVFDYKQPAYFGTLVGSHYGVYTGTVNDIMDNGISYIAVNNNFNYQIENEKDEKEEKTYYNWSGSISDTLNGDAVALVSATDNNNTSKKAYKLKFAETETDIINKYEIYALYNDSNTIDYLYIIDKTSDTTTDTTDTHIKYVYWLNYKENAVADATNIMFKVVEDENKKYSLETLTDAYSLDYNLKDSKVDKITELKLGGNNLIDNKTIIGSEGCSIDNDVEKAIAKKVNDALNKKISQSEASNYKVYYNTKRLKIFESDNIDIFVNIDTQNQHITDVQFDIKDDDEVKESYFAYIKDVLGDNPNTTDITEVNYWLGITTVWTNTEVEDINSISDDSILVEETVITSKITTRIDDIYGWNIYQTTEDELKFDEERAKIKTILKDFQNQALVQIYLDCVYFEQDPTHGTYKYNIDAYELFSTLISAKTMKYELYSNATKTENIILEATVALTNNSLSSSYTLKYTYVDKNTNKSRTISYEVGKDPNTNDSKLLLKVLENYLGWGDYVDIDVSGGEEIITIKETPTGSPTVKELVQSKVKGIAQFNFKQNYKILATTNKDEHGNIISELSELILTKDKLISSSINSRINTADLFKLVFGDAFNTNVDGVSTIFPTIEINLNKEETPAS